MNTQACMIDAEALFVRALCEDSNREQDWLGLATLLLRENERRYCFERVLRINPHSTVAQAELAQLAPIPAHLGRLAGYAA